MSINSNLEEARHFLSLVAPDDEITFQTFGEGSHKEDPNLRKNHSRKPG